jgi:hypothetical protein
MPDPTPPTQLGDIEVVGQRRRPGGVFPSAGGGGGGNTGDSPGRTIELDDGDPEPPQQTDPCANPDTALEWNADAAAAEALRRMQDDAGDELLDGRERSFVIYKDRNTGRIRLGNIAVGANMAGSVTPDMTGIDYADVIGLIHSHPGSGPYPSGPDQSNFTAFWQPQIVGADGDPSQFRLYIVGTRADPGGQARLQIRVYDETNLNGDEDNPGPEVNPNGEPCP